MVFRVDPEKVREFSVALAMLGEDAPIAVAYTESWVRASGVQDGIFANFSSTAGQVADKLSGQLNHLGTILTESGTELDRLASYFIEQEHSRAAEVDSTYTGYENIPDYSPKIGSSPLPNQPIDAISGIPDDSNPIPVLGDIILHGAGVLLSPSAIILTIIELFNNGKNPLDDALKWVSGDWNQAEQGSNALKNLAKFHLSMADEIHLPEFLPEYRTSDER